MPSKNQLSHNCGPVAALQPYLRLINDTEDLALTAASKCQLGTLWAIALQHGARKDAVAKVHVAASGYNFKIEVLNVNLYFDLNCHLKPFFLGSWLVGTMSIPPINESAGQHRSAKHKGL